MTQPLTPLQPRQKLQILQNVKSCGLLQMKMDNVIPCVKCDKIFYNAKDLTNHLGVHAAMDRKVDVQKSYESMKNTKMQVMMENMKLPIERNKRKREGSGENDLKRIKIQDGTKEISVNCQVDKLTCKICKPNRNFKEPQAYRYHMVVTHSDLDSTTLPSTPPLSHLGPPNECLTPSKSKVRVKSQASTIEIVDMAEESPNKSVMDKLKSLTCTSVSVCHLPSTLKSEKIDTEELLVNNCKLGKFPHSLDQVRRSTKKRGKRSTNGVVNVDNLVQSESLSNSVNLKFKEYVTADSESDFEILDKEVVDKCKDVNKNKASLEGDEMFHKVSAVIDKVLMHKNSRLTPATSRPTPSCLQKYPTISCEKPTDPRTPIKLIVNNTNGLRSPVKSLSAVINNSYTQLFKVVKSPKSIVRVSEDVKKEGTEHATESEDMLLEESPRSKSGRLLVKSKRLISTESADSQSIDNLKSNEVASPFKICVELSSSKEAVQSFNAGEYDHNLKQACSEASLERLKAEPLKASSSSSSKSKVKSDSDSYNPESQTSDSATANSDVEFAQPLRKSSRVRGPKPPQIRDPIENPAPKAKRRLSERKFEGAKPFKCNHCPLSYSNIESKKIHEQTHEEKPHQCVYCDMRFAVEISLKKHTKIHKT